MNRRTFLRSAAIAQAAAGSAISSAQAKPRRAIVIMTDTTRWDMLNCYRRTGLKTPNLDRMAEGGIRFDRAYTCQPVCSPARSALFTGSYPHTNGMWSNSLPLGQTVHTVGERLSDKGIHTAYIGKWHLDGADYFGTGRCPNGWDKKFWFDGRNYLDELTPEDRVRSRNQETNRDPKLTAEFTYAHKCSNRAIDFLKRHGKEDFLLVVSYDEPHGPFVCPKPYSEMYKDYVFPKNENVDDTLAGKPEHQHIWAASVKNPASQLKSADYFGCHTFVDAEIGRVLDAIEQYVPDALQIYTSDHGDFLGSHRLGNKGPAMYDEITRIPFLVRWPGHAPAKSVCPHPISHINLVPTLMESFGVPVPKTLEGRSILAAFEDPKKRVNDAVFTEFGRYEVDHDGFGAFQPMRCAFDGRFKLTVNLLCTDEFYDLEADPNEMKNLIDSPAHAAKRNALHDQLIAWMNNTRDPFRGYYWERRPWRPDQPATWGGAGMTRQRENDGYEPRQLIYETGLEMKEAVRKK